MTLHVENTLIPEVKIVTPKKFGDMRGFFSESWNKEKMNEAGFNYDFVQDNHSLSKNKNTIRGLHFQRPPFAQTKLIRCGRGAMFDVAVDFRIGSPTFGKWVGCELSFENGKQLLIPEGFLHGFITRVPNTEIIYKCTNYYAENSEGSVRFDDPLLNINWGLKVRPSLSKKDEEAPYLDSVSSPFVWKKEI